MHFTGSKVRKRAKIRNRYSQAPHLTQDTNGKVSTSQLDIKNESQEVSPFPAGDHLNLLKTDLQLKPKTAFWLPDGAVLGEMSRDMRFHTMWYMRPAKAKISLYIHAV